MAEICDRLMRYISAVFYNIHAEELKEEEEVRQEYDIPAEVPLMYELDWGPHDSILSRFSPLIRDWVKGKLTEEEANYMLFYFQEVQEIEYGWIFMGEPMGFYSGNADHDHIQKMDQKFLSIGTRSHKKRNGKPIRKILPPVQAAAN